MNVLWTDNLNLAIFPCMKDTISQILKRLEIMPLAHYATCSLPITKLPLNTVVIWQGMHIN